MRFEVVTSATSVGLGFGGVVSGIFGMNVSPGSAVWSEDPDGTNFGAIIFTIVCGSVGITTL